MELVAELKKERAILTSETEELRKSLGEVCHAAIVIQKSFRRFQAKQGKWREKKERQRVWEEGGLAAYLFLGYARSSV